MRGETFVVLSLICIAAMIWILLQSGNRDEKHRGEQIASTFDWIWIPIMSAILIVIMLAVMDSARTGQPFQNPVSLVGTPIDDARAQVADRFFAILFGEQ